MKGLDSRLAILREAKREMGCAGGRDREDKLLLTIGFSAIAGMAIGVLVLVVAGIVEAWQWITS